MLYNFVRFSLIYILLIGGEALIGVIMGFYVQIIFAAFSSAGQFMAFQMGFSAASTYDALSQVENPLMGQFFNFIAMLVFMQTQWFQRLFLGGLSNSLRTFNIITLISNKQHFIQFMLKGLSKLFADALIISLPIMGTLLLITVCTGLLSKAAPQMNLLSEGFPIMILLSFFLIQLTEDYQKFHLSFLSSSAFCPACLCILYSFVTTILANNLIKGTKTAYKFFIITSHPEAVEDKIIHELKHSATRLHGEGVYSHEGKTVLVSVCNKNQLMEFESMLKSFPDTFAFVETVNDTLGNFKHIK